MVFVGDWERSDTQGAIWRKLPPLPTAAYCVLHLCEGLGGDCTEPHPACFTGSFVHLRGFFFFYGVKTHAEKLTLNLLQSI